MDSICSNTYGILLYSRACSSHIFLALFVTAIKPYRNDVYNCVDTALTLLLAMIYSSILSFDIANIKETRHVKATLQMSFVLAALSLVYLFFICVYWVLTHRVVNDRLLYGTRIDRIKARSTQESEYTIPYRLFNPEDCDLTDTM